jgi:hypothetical protein
MKVRAWALIGAFSILAAACGAAGGDTGGASGGRTVELDGSDTGRTVNLNPGDRLVISLAVPSPKTHWVLGRFPEKALALTSRDQNGTYEFAARRAGRGNILIVDFLRASDLLDCRGRVGARPPALCPVSDEATLDALPPRAGVFTLTVVVRP